MASDDEFDVSKYTDEQLFGLLNLLPNPTDRELEAQILNMIRKYSQYGNQTGDRLAQFYIDIYSHFFEDPIEEGEDTKEGMETMNSANASNPAQVVQSSEQTADNSLTATTTKKATTENGIQLTKPLDYAKDKLNPLLKQSIKRIISIDSQYRDNKASSSTQFTFNLSEPLRDVVSLSLYSVQIPYTWYTINGNFGGNFIYIKGLSPGINNGNHDYKIQIPSGNYTPDGLVSKVNDSIQKMAALNTTVDFGKTSIIFNDGIASSVGGTGKAKFLVDIKNVYGEANYFLQFPNWTSPVSTIDVRSNSIAAYLGFNDATHKTTGIYSNYLTGLSSGPSKTDEFTLTAANSYFDIIPYVGTSYLSADAASIYSSKIVRVSLWDSNANYTSRLYNRAELVSLMDTALKSNVQLDPNFSYCRWVDISGIDQYGQYQYNYGNSYIEIHCKLNKQTAPIVQNLKLAARFPSNSVGIFTSDSSCFKIGTSLIDSSQNPIYEMNNVLADTSILQSNYPVVGTNELHFICTSDGYDLSYNSFIVSLDPSPAGYTLQEYIAKVNTSIRTVPELVGTNAGTSTTSMYLSRDNYVYLQTYIRKSFGNQYYAIKGTGAFINRTVAGTYTQGIFNLPSEYEELSTNHEYSNSNYVFNGIAFNAADKIIVSPIQNTQPPSGIEVTENEAENVTVFTIRFTSGAVYNSVPELEIYLNSTITQFTSTDGRRPFANSKVEYIAGRGFVLTMNVQTLLTQNDYSVMFYSTSVPNSWAKNLDFSNNMINPTYILRDFSMNDGVYSLIRNNATKSDNQIELFDGSDNYLTVQPYSTIDGLQTTNDQYSLRISLTPGKYSVVSLLDSINAQLTASDIMRGSKFEIVSVRGQLYVQMRWNINKVFSTKDYQLVFYDPISFVSCYSGASSSGAKSIQNATWDTTLGWILGFRNQITYNLADYVQNIYYNETPDLEYYLTGTDSNVFTLIGDTAVSTNLYNYFLIVLDDYVQNHLNDGLVTVTSQDTTINHAPAIFVCDPATGQKIARPADYGSPGVYYTDKQLYSFNQQVQSNSIKNRSYSKGPFVQDVFGIIPIKPGTIGSVYIEFGGTLQNQQRMYFGPVNIHRMTIRLLNDRGDLVDLNNANWGFSLICEQLYKK